MTMSGFKWGSGKNAFMGSLSEYLITQIPDEFFDFDNPILPVKLPGYGVIELGLFNLGPMAMGNYVGMKDNEPVYGRKNQTLVEISAWDDVTKHSDAAGKVRQMRDKVIWMLYNAGRRNEDGSVILPPIKMYDYYQEPKVETGVIWLDDSDNAINEKFMVDPVSQNIKVYKMLIRLFWIEYL